MPDHAFPPPFSCRVVPDGDRPCVEVCGELDLATVDAVEDRLRELRDGGHERLLLDLQRVTFADSTGVTLILRWAHVADFAGWDFRVVLSPAVRDVCALAGVLDRLRTPGD